MTYRCTNAFEYANRIYPGGVQIEDDDPILASHSGHFAKVQTAPSFVAAETASAAPGEVRAVTEPERPRRGRPRKTDQEEG